MSIYIDCLEPYARPVKRTMEVQPGDEVALYVLPLASGRSAGLRRTLLRPQDQNPPAESRLVMWLKADNSGLTVAEVTRGMTVELIRHDLRSQVVPGMRLTSSAQFEITMPDRSHLGFGLTVRQKLDQGAAAGVAGSGTKKSRVIFASDNVWWLITDSKGIVVTFWVKIFDRVKDRLVAAGIDSRVITFGTGLLISGLVFGYVAYTQYGAAAAAQEAADKSAQEASLAKAAREAALATELACLEDREALAKELGKKREQRKFLAEAALQVALSQSVVRERGAESLHSPLLVQLDLTFHDDLIDAVVSRLSPPSDNPQPCLEQTAALGSDLPTYLLMWHPNEELTCPEKFQDVVNGVTQRGRFGLSDRLVAEFGEGGNVGTGTREGVMDQLVGDARDEVRWSSFTLADAYREILWTLLETEPATRPSVLPSQAELWTLAFLNGYNFMPSPAGGVLDRSVSDCVVAVLNDRERQAPPATQGEPVLPDILAVALKETTVIAKPTPGCPWPTDAMMLGANAALRSAGRLTAYNLAQAEQREGPQN